jgi:hypothetical protein
MATRIRNCRVCGREFFREPLLRYDNMPKAAQFLPDKNALDEDKGVDLEVCQCSGCGLVQLSGAPVPYYREVIRASAFSQEMRVYRLKQFGKFVEDYSLRNEKIIEIGCGRGEYLSLMRQAGANAFGLEQGEESVAQCLKDGLQVSRGFVESCDYKIPRAPFRAFFILNFLEHLPDLRGTLAGIYNNLTDSGVGLVEVPNFDMILRNNLFSEFIADHLFYFTKATLTTALLISGFEVIECGEIWQDYIISAVVRKRPGTDLTRFYEHQSSLKQNMEEFLNRFGDKRVAVWGAGHQAFALLALTGLSGKFRYVVDSAPFKQGKYTPATHLRILPPEALESEPVDAVLVMAGGYSDEVARIIRRKFGQHIGVGIMRENGVERA